VEIIWADTTTEAGSIGVPEGGLTGQSLIKASNSNYDTTWADRVSSASIFSIEVISQEDYDELDPPDSMTLYFILED